MDARRFTRSVYGESEGPRVVKSSRSRRGHAGRCIEGGGGRTTGERERERGGSAEAIRESATTSGGSVDPAAKVCLVRDAERADVCTRDPRIGSPLSPSERKEKESSDLSKRELSLNASDEISP